MMETHRIPCPTRVLQVSQSMSLAQVCAVDMLSLAESVISQRWSGQRPPFVRVNQADMLLLGSGTARPVMVANVEDGPVYTRHGSTTLIRRCSLSDSGLWRDGWKWWICRPGGNLHRTLASDI